MRLKVENASLSALNANEKTAVIRFDVSWQEAWKNDVNCDGVWLFAKYQGKDGLWKHVVLSAGSPREFDYTDQTPAGFSKGDEPDSSLLGMWAAPEKTGAFLFLTQGESDVSVKNVSFIWDLSNTDIKDENDVKTLKVFGFEMVYVAEDKHYIGDPLGTKGPKNCLYTYPDNGAYLVNSENEITVDAKEGFLYCDQDNERSRDDTPFTVPETFPKGYKAFWYMKYGISCQQYVNFLNTLTRKQQQTQVLADVSGDKVTNYHVMTDTAEEKFRQSIVCAKSGNGTTAPITFYTYAPARACNGIAWKNTVALAAWSGLRPVTDFEYEKACRGPLPAVEWECAWGSNEIGRVDTFSGADGSGTEIKVPVTGLVNACLGAGIAPFDAAAGKTEPDNPGFEGPITCGLFSFTRHEGIPKRLNDGASYYGVMELSGNLWEPVVSFGSPKGRAFKPIHGKGELNADGYARVDTWPDESGEGHGARGGVYRSPDATYLAIALRFAGAHAKSTPRFNGGIRVGY